MPLTRKIRQVGDSLMVAIPAQLAAMVGIEAGNEMEFDHIGEGALRVRKSQA